MKKLFNTFKAKSTTLALKTKQVLLNKSGEGFIDQAISILIAVVIGALLLAGLYMIFGDVVLPTLTERIKEMFNYAG